jgi:hypothetical protein
MREPIIRELGQSMYLVLLLAGAMALFLSLGLFAAWALS